MSGENLVSDRRVGKHAWVGHGFFFVLGAVAALACKALFSPSPVKTDAPDMIRTNWADSGAQQPHIGSKGPWGVLEWENIPLEPDEVDVEGMHLSIPTRWIFTNYSPSRLAGLFNSCELTDAQKDFLLDTNHWGALTNGYAVSPPDALILSLGQTARQSIYPVLARNPANGWQYFPFRFSLNGFDERFSGSGLPSRMIELVRQQTYTNNGAICFSTLPAMSGLFATNDLASLLVVLYRTPALIVRLRVNRDSNIKELVQYWGKGGREKTVRPLLESLVRSPGQQNVNISYLLPPFARLRLYAYPDPGMDPSAAQQDCFYTALNFFNTQPDQKYLDLGNARKALLNDYYPVQGPMTFGDLIVLMDSANNGFHACVYVADDIVFSKNGSHSLQPWILMKMPEMLSEYSYAGEFRTVHLRKKRM